MPPLRMKQIPQQRATARVAPTVYLETIPAFCGGRTLAGPLRDGNLRGGGGASPPYGSPGTPLELGRGGPWASRRGRTASQESTLIRLACARHLLPRREKAYGRLIAAPTGENGPEALARPNQARGRNRNSRNSGTVRAQWPGRNFDCHSDFARRKFP